MTTTPAPTTHHDLHAHDSTCWWDFRQARWSCQFPPATRSESADPLGTEECVDVRDMVVVHTALLRELRLAPAAVLRAADRSSATVRAVAGHLDLMCSLLHHHHEGEDELLWPVLRPRLTAQQAALLDVAESQHAGIDRALQDVAASTQSWRRLPGGDETQALVAAMDVLNAVLAEHLETEERLLLPLAATHLSEREWLAVGEAGAASVPRRSMLLVLGMFAYEGDPVVLAQMLAAAPAPVRAVVLRLAPRAYARHAARVHGTRRP